MGMSNAYPVKIEGRSITVSTDRSVTVATPIDARVPLGTTERGLLIRDVQENVRSVCGRVACWPSVVFENEDPLTVKERNIITGGIVYCNKVDCPLSPNQGRSGDREPRNPLPNQPSMAATL